MTKVVKNNDVVVTTVAFSEALVLAGEAATVSQLIISVKALAGMPLNDLDIVHCGRI